MISICAGDPSQWLRCYRGQRPFFAGILSFTETGLIPQISAAGRSPHDRQYTALADGEFLAQAISPAHPPSDSAPRGQQRPVLTAGVSPVVITRAVLYGQTIPYQLLSTGLPRPLRAPHIALPQVRARPVYTGQAMTHQQTTQLLKAGLLWGHRLARHCPNSYLIVGECVVGGTTTAQAILTALGYPAAGLISSSHPTGNHNQKTSLIRQGLAKWHAQSNSSAIAAVAALGDPMQMVAAGMTLAASQTCGILLAGGSQMLAVYALTQAIAHQQKIKWNPDQIVVGTTRWVIEDSSADTVAIAQAIQAPYLAAEIDFQTSPYVHLRAYEQGFVKEGMGAGGCAIAAHLHQGWNRTQIRHAVEAQVRQYL